ncbi:MAG: hypothetical protein ACOYUZ_03790 [Patescibacteria group bacterium]
MEQMPQISSRPAPETLRLGHWPDHENQPAAPETMRLGRWPDQPLQSQEPPEQSRLETLRTIEHTEDIATQLSIEMSRAYPYRQEQILTRLKQDADLRKKILESNEIGGIAKNKPLLIRLENGQDAVYKPQNREQAELARGIPVGSYAAREWLVAQIDQALQLDLVPPTVLRDGPEGMGSVQAWQDNCEVGMGVDYWESPRVEQIKLALLDAITGNVDRHAGNFLVEKQTGRYVAIDNGLVFSSNAADQTWSAALREVGGQNLSDQDMQVIGSRINAFFHAPGVQQVLRRAFDLALGYEAESAWEKFVSSLRNIEHNHQLPKSEK